MATKYCNLVFLQNWTVKLNVVYKAFKTYTASPWNPKLRLQLIRLSQRKEKQLKLTLQSTEFCSEGNQRTTS